jgi:hypothetical protein
VLSSVRQEAAMDAVGGKSRMDVSSLIGRVFFDVAWIAHQQCCFWSSVAMQGSEIRNRSKK